MIDLITVITAFLARWKGAFITVLSVFLLAAIAFGSPAFAQIPKVLSVTQSDTQESETAEKVVTTEQQREITKRALTEAQKERARALVASPGFSRQDVKERYRLLDGLVTSLSSQLSLINEREELRAPDLPPSKKHRVGQAFRSRHPILF